MSTFVPHASQSARLEYLATDTPLELDTSSMRAAMTDAASSGVPMADVKEAQVVLRTAEQAQAPRDAAAALLARLSGVTALEMSVDATRRALEEASDAGVAAAKLATAKASLAAAEKAQSERDEAACLMVLTAATPPLDAEKMRSAVAKAQALHVRPSLIACVEAKMTCTDAEGLKAAAKARAVTARTAAEAAKQAADATLAAASAHVTTCRKLAEVAMQRSQACMLEAVAKDTKLLAGGEATMRASPSTRTVLGGSGGNGTQENLMVGAADDSADGGVAAGASMRSLLTSTPSSAPSAPGHDGGGAGLHAFMAHFHHGESATWPW